MQRAFSGAAVSRLHGQRLDVPVFAPAAGQDWTFLLAGGYQYRILLASWTLTTSAQGGKRFPSFQIKDGDGFQRLVIADNGEVLATKTASMFLGRNLTTTISHSELVFTFEATDMLIDAGWSIGSSTAGINTEDQISGVRLLLEQLIEARPGQGYGQLETPLLEIDLEGSYA